MLGVDTKAESPTAAPGRSWTSATGVSGALGVLSGLTGTDDTGLSGSCPNKEELIGLFGCSSESAASFGVMLSERTTESCWEIDAFRFAFEKAALIATLALIFFHLRCAFTFCGDFPRSVPMDCNFERSFYEWRSGGKETKGVRARISILIIYFANNISHIRTHSQNTPVNRNHQSKQLTV